MDHDLDIEARHRADLLRIAQDLNLPLVATNDLHYVREDDASAHDVLLCIGTRATVNDEKRFRFNGSGYFLKPADQMRQIWSELPQACDNTLLIAERCNVEFDDSANLMPRFDVPEGETEDSWMAKEVHRGLAERFAPHPVPETHPKAGRFRTVGHRSDGLPELLLGHRGPGALCQSQRDPGWSRPWFGRRCLDRLGAGHHRTGPVEHGLIFERFLNPDRVSMPDIDMDFDERRRGEMIRYATEKYGDDQVAQIVTYSSIKAKAAIKGLRARTRAALRAVRPDHQGHAGPRDGQGHLVVRHLRPQAPRYGRQRLPHPARRGPAGAAGRSHRPWPRGPERQPGVHAAGVILSRAKLLDVVPLWKRDDGSIITQFDMDACEKLGLLKMDFLGLRNLTVLDDCLDNIEHNKGERVVLEDLPLDNAEAYRLLARGDTLGVFQLDGGPMRALLRLMKPDSFDDISAVLALYRPGPMGANAHNDYADRKNKRQPVTPIHPELAEPLEDILNETYGVIVYQEQVMTIAQRVAGYSLGQADLLRRAMGKKKKEILDQEFGPFAAGMRANGYSDAAINTLWDILVPFADYAFNKAHSAGYGLVSYWTALPQSQLSDRVHGCTAGAGQGQQGQERDLSGGMPAHGRQGAAAGRQRLPVAVHSGRGHDPLRAVRCAQRRRRCRRLHRRVAHGQGRFTDFPDFLSKVEASACNKRVVESLIKAGAFDSLGPPAAA